MRECPRNTGGGEKKRASYLREGRKDEHNGGAGRDSSRLIAMGLLLETVEDVTEKQGTQRGIQNKKDLKKKQKKGPARSLSLQS